MNHLTSKDNSELDIETVFGGTKIEPTLPGLLKKRISVSSGRLSHYQHFSTDLPFLPLQYGLNKMGQFITKNPWQSLLSLFVIGSSCFICGYMTLTLTGVLMLYIHSQDEI